jgi:hypothetical protein
MKRILSLSILAVLMMAVIPAVASADGWRGGGHRNSGWHGGYSRSNRSSYSLSLNFGGYGGGYYGGFGYSRGYYPVYTRPYYYAPPVYYIEPAPIYVAPRVYGRVYYRDYYRNYRDHYPARSYHRHDGRYHYGR